jgi:hypothetical protein
MLLPSAHAPGDASVRRLPGQAHLNFNDNDDLQVKVALQHQRTPSNGVNGVKEHKIIEIGRSRQRIIEMLRLINRRIDGLLDALALRRLLVANNPMSGYAEIEVR